MPHTAEALARFPITTFEAMRFLDVYHCPARVLQLRKAGHRIVTLWQSKIEGRLAEHWQRPKGMRLKTYVRLTDQLAVCEQRREAAFCQFAARFMAMTVRL